MSGEKDIVPGYNPTLANMTDEELLRVHRTSEDPLVCELIARLTGALETSDRMAEELDGLREACANGRCVRCEVLEAEIAELERG